jgi:hypothetical protein
MIYTHVTQKDVRRIRFPLDNIAAKDELAVPNNGT